MATFLCMSEPEKKPGPDPEHVKLDEDWKEAVRKAVKKKRPPEGWPHKEKGEEPAE